mmetsp:Transcript_7207/g.12150  ORF Transcript_7207/g.12150 Transcript_7207/m.12150 type:complete len:269 (-) Transcript_7207:263-1069(-)
MSQAEQLKRLGNDCFSRGKIDAAIDAYSEAICLEPNNSVYHTNRALCYQKKKAWAQVTSDCNAALAIDSISIKAYYLLGTALVEQGDYVTGIPQLQRALELCKEQTVSYKDDIRRMMLSARKKQWEADQLINTATLTDAEQLVAQLLGSHYSSQANAVDSVALQAQANGVYSSTSDAFAALRSVRVPSQVPDHLCCKISMELMLDPVVTPSGITYERSCLTDHLLRVGNFDPVTRAPMTRDQIAPNLALKEVIEQYLQERPWAYQSCM